MLTVRLPDELESEINRIASEEKKSKSEIVKDALQRFVEEHRGMKSSYELGQDLFGRVGSGESNRSQTYRKKVKEKIRAKHSH